LHGPITYVNYLSDPSVSSWLATTSLSSSSKLRFPDIAIASGITASRVFLHYYHTTDVMAATVLGATAGLLRRRIIRWCWPYRAGWSGFQL